MYKIYTERRYAVACRQTRLFYYTSPNLIQLLDDDIVALTALTQIVNPEFRNERHNIVIRQLTMSLYLVAQCQMKLCQSVTSLAKTMDYIEYRYARHNSQPIRLTS